MNSKQNKAEKRQDFQDDTFIKIESRLYSLLLIFQFKAHFLDIPLPQKPCPDARHMHSSLKDGNAITNVYHVDSK